MSLKVGETNAAIGWFMGYHNVSGIFVMVSMLCPAVYVCLEEKLSRNKCVNHLYYIPLTPIQQNKHPRVYNTFTPPLFKTIIIKNIYSYNTFVLTLISLMTCMVLASTPSTPLLLWLYLRLKLSQIVMQHHPLCKKHHRRTQNRLLYVTFTRKGVRF